VAIKRKQTAAPAYLMNFGSKAPVGAFPSRLL
jgi:hypothetical protein